MKDVMQRLSHRSLLPVVLALAGACGGAQQPAGPTGDSAEPAGVVTDTRTPFEKRLDAACQAVEPMIVDCTVADSRAELAAGRISQQQFDDLTTRPMLDALAREWDERCDRRNRTSKQVRVLEVCHKEETACAPFLDCLTHFDK